MNWFNNLKISNKLFLAFGVLILLGIIRATYVTTLLNNLDSVYANLVESTSRRLNDLDNSNITLSRLRLNNVSSAYPIYDDEISQSLLYMRSLDYEDLCGTFTAHLNNYRKNVTNDKSLTAGGVHFRLQYTTEIENQFNTHFVPCYYKIREGVLELNKTKASEGLHDEIEAGTELTTLLTDLRDMDLDYINTELERITAYSKNIAETRYIVDSVIAVLLILISFFMARIIGKPIHNLETASGEIANGNLSYPIRSTSRDELGILSNRIGDMVDTLKNATEAKSAFLANMSHEMRTPLNVITGLTELLMDDKNLPESINDDIKKINSAGGLLLGLVNDVLDISKIEAGRLELVPVNYSTASFLNDIITLNMIRIDSKPIKFIVEINEKIPRELFGDELRVKQIFNNLLSNAFKYTKEGTVTFAVDISAQEAAQVDGNDLWLLASIRDTGIGIRPEDLKKLFSEYNQVDIKANRKIEGTGLGLAITKKLLEMMDGEINVESEFGKGSTFSVKLRQKIVNPEILGGETAEKISGFRYSDDKKHMSAGLERPNLSFARVLVVDDYRANLDVASRMLQKYELRVDCVNSGQKAVDLVMAGDPVYDLIFMDHMMPEMDGIEATELIRGIDSEYARNVPIISLTANALAGSEQMFLDKGFNAFLAKPINILKLDQIVKKWIGQSGPRATAGQIPAGHQPDKPKALNTDVQNELYGGDAEMYKFALESFTRNTPASIDLLQNVTAENLADYAINVHALKSMAAAIGAGEISARAKNLELTAKSGGLSGVLAENTEFLKDTQILVDDVKKYLGNL